ncbi:MULTISPECIES: P-loop NTPase fold protein [unclassified Sulfurospirillum]|uniref:P-loop NTPase fold protein n=1 Tax=unclassified Sulfurospirillum TaxID=2618290 RepID=UPI000508C006|nr:MULTISPECIES: P-loop NTPase fold protein [unclassified Sulfurospirillum]KFL34703.1 hypothetical protein JU57_03460 [Sulfurospirillum sp. SCADC]
MANSESIKQYLIEGKKPYLENDDNNGTILMLSGAWGSGKTHFWKNIIEKDLIPKIKAKKKSYVFVSLYGKDSIKDIENEILQKAYSFLYESDNDLIKKASSVFTKSVDFIPKISFFGFEIDAKNIAKLKDELSNKEKLHKASEALSNGIVCFDDFERKSSKIDLNDLFGFITNLTENFQTKTIIITKQEAFLSDDKSIFNTVKEKSVNKFILYSPSVEELFDVIYQNDKYKLLKSYKTTILDAIQLSEEKNARIYIQVLNNCLEYVEKIKDVNERTIYLLTFTTIIFVKYNLLIRLTEIAQKIPYIRDSEIKIFPDFYIKIPENILYSLKTLNTKTLAVMEVFLHDLKHQYSLGDSKTLPTEVLKDNFLYIETNKDKLFILYKYFYHQEYFSTNDIEIVNKISGFIESGILLEE